MTTAPDPTTGPDTTAAQDTTVGPDLILGPMLRYIGETEATVWVETDRACEVEVLGRRARTFAVAGHHYALVVLDGLAPGSETEYQVTLDGTVRWPLPDSGFPPSVLRTLGGAHPVRVAFGSCRVAEIAPGNLSRRERRQLAAARQLAARREAGEQVSDGEQPMGPDALAATAAVLARTPHDRWPDVLLMIGDQVYADEPGPATREFIAQHRASLKATAVTAEARAAADVAESAPGNQVADFAEYCALYWEAWSDPAVRWLLSVVPTAMIFDDHDVHDDWNTSAAWRDAIARQPWWPARIESAFQSYWLYQHLGNQSPAELAGDPVWAQVRAAPDAAAVLARLARQADQRAPGVRWSTRRTFGGGRVRVVLLDSRSRRVVHGGPRLMADEQEWDWLTEAVTGDWDHVVIATSVPPLLPRGIHALEAWTERLAAGVWGQYAARFGERLRQDFDLEHWPAFGASFSRLERLLAGLAAGRLSPGGEPPASVTVISGDIHQSYLAEVTLPKSARRPGGGRVSGVYEAVCSPFHQAIPPQMRYAQQLAGSPPSGLAGTVVSALAGARLPAISWRRTAGPWFTNMIAVLEFDGAAARVRFDRAAGADGLLNLETEADLPLS